MIETRNRSTRVIDILIYSFFIIFLLSLSNSIFFNQVGYFGALLFILIKYAVTRKNQFEKTGLELAFALYIISEILSAVFSEYKSEAFAHVFKRAVLIPVFYTAIAVTTDQEWGKRYFKIFIAGSLITFLVYLYSSLQYYLKNLYNITLSGPSLFQHPITASEIIGFTLLFLFAFLVNEKTSMRNRIFIFIGFVISVLTLLATYKRTGWMGAAAGILVILIATKKWKILLAGVVLFVVLLFVDRNVSMITVYKLDQDKTEKLYSLETEGRATEITSLDSLYIISDFENGLSVYKDSVLIKNIPTPVPVYSVNNFSENLFIARLMDTRFLLMKRDGINFTTVKEILSPGNSIGYTINGNNFFILDSDSGLTVYENLPSEKVFYLYRQFAGYKHIFSDSSYFYFASEDSGVTVFSNENFNPGKRILNQKIGRFKRFHVFGSSILVTSDKESKLYKFQENEFVLKETLPNLKDIYKIREVVDELFILKTDGTVLRAVITENLKFNFTFSKKIDPAPTAVNYISGKLYCTHVYRSRLLSFFDPYLQTNFTRITLWRTGLEIFKDYPVFGIGDIDAAKYFVKYKRNTDKEIHGHFHNNYVHWLVTLGIVGVLAIGFLLFKIISVTIRMYRKGNGKPFISSYSLGTLASFVSILVAGLAEQNFWDQEITTLIYFTIGLNIALFRRFNDSNPG